MELQSEKSTWVAKMSDGGTWYPEACISIGLKHRLHASCQKSIIERTMEYGVVAVANVGSVGLVGWIGEMRAICDEFSVKPSTLGQEMGYGYGLDHSRVHDSEADYEDQYE